MSPKNTPFIHVGLTALGWFGYAATSAADPGPPGQPAAPAVTAAPSPTPTVLSLYDGRVLPGKIQVDDAGYSVVQNGGVLRFPKGLVEGAFGSLQEVYRFKAGRVPARDPDERLKLAQWCLSNHLNAEAKAQLLAVQELCPDDPRVKNMVVNIDQALARATVRDEGLVRTRAEQPADGRPAELDPGLFRPGRAAPPALGLPMIFDLPQPIAVKRADEFAQGVHKILQNRCARCHHENYQGEFQLIQVKNRHQWTANVARANLEATLRVVDPDSPSRSELLARSLVPHGPLRNPIFRGANDPEYRRIAAWVNSLRPRPATDQAATPRFGPSEPASAPAEAEGFATDRMPPPGPALPADTTADGRPQPPATPNPVTPLPPGQYLAGSGSGQQPYAPAEADFPVPYMMGGPRPKVGATPGAPPPSPPGQVPPPAPPQSGAVQAPPATAVTAGGTLPPLPATSQAPPAAPAGGGAGAMPPKKPVKLDPALLERALMNKYTPNQ